MERVVVHVALAFGPIGCGAGSSEAAEAPSSESGSSSAGSETGSDAFFTDEERETILQWLGPLPATPPPDPSNAFADDAAAALLGQAFFFDPSFSQNGAISCATCHDPATGFADARANTSEGLAFTPRAAPTILNGAFGAASEDAGVWQFWDGRCDSQWAQALQPVESAKEMGSARTTVALLIYDAYRSEYEAAFGPMPALRDGAGDPTAPAGLVPGEPEWEALPQSVRDDVDGVFVGFGKAIAAYERRLVSRDSAFDRFWSDLEGGAPDSTALGDLEKQGLRVFIGNGRCLGCHSGPNFTDAQFHNIAVAQVGTNVPATDEGRASGLPIALADDFNCAGKWSDHPDKRACAVATLAGAAGELGAFKTPTLRELAATAPYMHTGGLTGLEQVVQHYDFGGSANGTFDGVRDELIRPLGLSAPERTALVAFLRALGGAPLDPALLGPP